MPTLTIDGIKIEAKDGATILEAAGVNGIFIPHFCYHKNLSIAGNCRMCAVEIKGNAKPVISCKETVRDGIEVFTNSAMVAEARQSALEFILINHPLDCPICDKAGECILQNYYQKYSLKPSRFMEKKVKKPKAVKAGHYITLDAERCVECARCVRFCNEITKTSELTISERGDSSEIGVFPQHELNNPYSLCTVDLCPVGALTSTDFRFKKRVWFLKSAPSVCDGCATGCNIFIDHSDGVVYRYRPRGEGALNGEWLCDYGRLSYKKINSEERVLYPRISINGELVSVGIEEALSKVKELVGELKQDEIAGILSAKATVEENEALARFLGDVIKTPNIYWSGSDTDPSFSDDILRNADKNPNTRGVVKFTNKRLEDEPTAKGYFILNEVTQNELMKIVSSRPKWIVLLASHHNGARFPDVILPKVTFAEQSGTFINKDGLEQKFEKAIEPKENILTVREIVSRL